MTSCVAAVRAMAWYVLALKPGPELNLEVTLATGFGALAPREAVLVSRNRDGDVVPKPSQVVQLSFPFLRIDRLTACASAACEAARGFPRKPRDATACQLNALVGRPLSECPAEFIGSP